MKEYEKILKALANHRRLQIVKFIKTNKRATVGVIASHIKLSFKSTSRHLSVLYSAEILEREQKDISMFYSIAKPLPKIADHIINSI